MTPCTNITIQDLLRSSSGISSKYSSPGSKCGLSVSDIFPTVRNTLNTSIESNMSNSDLSNETVYGNHSVFGSTEATLNGTPRTVEEPVKTAGEQVQEYRASKKFNWLPGKGTSKAKTPAERARKYREKKKLLALAAKEKATAPIALDTTESDINSCGKAVDRSICAQQNKKKRRDDGTSAKTNAQRAREYRARLKLELERERCNLLSTSPDSGTAKEYTQAAQILCSNCPKPRVFNNVGQSKRYVWAPGHIELVTVKKIAKTCAERARDYRARKKQSLADFRSNVLINSVEVGEYLQQGICTSVFNSSSQNVASYGHVSQPPSLLRDEVVEETHAYRARFLQSAVGPSKAVPSDESVYVGDKYNTISLESDALEKANVPLINKESLEEEEMKLQESMERISTNFPESGNEGLLSQGSSVLEPLISIKEEVLEEELEPLACVTLPLSKQELFEEEYENYGEDDPLNLCAI